MPPRRTVAQLLSIGALTVFSILPTLSAQPDPSIQPPPGDTEMIGPIKFGSVEVDGAIEMLEQWTGRIALRPQGLPATTIPLNISRQVTKAEAIQALETVLTMNGIAVAPLGDKFIKITPLAQSRAEAPEMIEGSTLVFAPSGRVATKLFLFKFLRASEIVPQISALLNPGMGAAPVIIERANAALITDTLSNLQRIETLLVQLDRPASEQMLPKFYSITNAKASDVANSVRTLLSGALANQFSAATTIQSDDRTNQIILVSDPRQVEFFDQLITKLDSKGETNVRQEVIFLKHAQAEDVATLLSQLVSGRTSATTGSGPQQQQRNRQTIRQQLNELVGNRNQGGEQPQQQQPQPGQPGGYQAPNIVQLAGPGGEGDGVTEFSTLLTILPEARSNSIVVSGTVDDIRLITELVERIDVLLSQVRIEVVIAEVTLSNEFSTGIEALGFTVQADKVVGFSGALPGLAVSNGTVTQGPNGSRDLSATLNLSTNPRKSHANILSVPTIVTTHNKEAVIFVGEQRPVITSYLANNVNQPGSGAGFSSTVSYRDIGIELKVKPLVSSDGAVELEITQEVNDILGEIIIDGNPQPRIGRRSTQSYVTARNGEIIALGGLQRQKTEKSTTQFGPIPIIGDLLGERRRFRERTDLIFFLRPYILTNTEADNAEIFERVKTGPQGRELKPILDGGSSPAAAGR